MFSGIRLLLIRRALGISADQLDELLRHALPDGVILNFEAFRFMINDLGQATSPKQRDDALAALAAATSSFLQTDYSPVVVIGDFNLDSTTALLVQTDSRGVVSVSLYANDELAARGESARRLRQQYALSASRSLLDSRRRKRRLKIESLEPARILNRHISATSKSTTISIDISGLTPTAAVAALLQRLVELEGAGTSSPQISK